MGQVLSEPITTKNTAVNQNPTYYVASSNMQGWRIANEDAHTVKLKLENDKAATYFGVFDGHGGSAVSLYASQHLHHRILEQHSYREGDYRRAIEEGFLALDEEMQVHETIMNQMCGSTAVIVLIKQKRLYCGNAGDSRAIAFTSHGVIPLSHDHKPTVPEEKARIIQSGNYVDTGRVNGNLAVSRALGDFIYKTSPNKGPRQQAVTCFPEVIEMPVDNDWQFIVLACDGIWDVMSSNDVSTFIRIRISNGFRPEEIVEQLLDACLAPDGQSGGMGTDNMTVILVVFVCNAIPAYGELLKSGRKLSPEERKEFSGSANITEDWVVTQPLTITNLSSQTEDDTNIE